MMTIAQVLEARGRQEAKQEMAERLLQEKLMSMENIAKVTGVSMETLQLLSKQKNVSKSS